VEQVDASGKFTLLIHFVFQLPERIACCPNMVEFHSTQYHPHYQRTDDPRAVTCPGCKNSDHYKRAFGGLRGK
jgi:hypothetical protein